MPSCSKCNAPTDYSNSLQHPAPYTGQWLCVNCYGEIEFPSAQANPIGTFRNVKAKR